ncbi:dephospho-CoA kinase [uncultured Aquimarina sp.]|uniref:dephospho-CoA kinase n=1 Tax=uncultured Aquimarina sp. TaxID=575652 RepID=UPI002636C593|nr:dephospho-CoA kinase [uncultured Aquimarina sp.]
MKVIGLTGGIGSGKSTVAKMFAKLGVPIYIADDEAKKMMNEDVNIKNQIKDLLGTKSYIKGELNRPFIADKVFNDKELLGKLNAIVHPAVATHFIAWKNEQKSNYVIKEAAILFENGGYKQCDYTVLVTAPKETRIERVLKRDNTTKSQVLARLKNQWEDSKKIPLADFVIINTKLEETWLQVKKIHNKVIL